MSNHSTRTEIRLLLKMTLGVLMNSLVSASLVSAFAFTVMLEVLQLVTVPCIERMLV